MTTYLTFVALWTLYMAFETYTYTRPQSRPYFVGLLITHTLLAPISFVLSLTGGLLQERIQTAYRAAKTEKENHLRSGRRKLIG